MHEYIYIMGAFYMQYFLIIVTSDRNSMPVYWSDVVYSRYCIVDECAVTKQSPSFRNNWLLGSSCSIVVAHWTAGQLVRPLIQKHLISPACPWPSIALHYHPLPKTPSISTTSYSQLQHKNKILIPFTYAVIHTKSILFSRLPWKLATILSSSMEQQCAETQYIFLLLSCPLLCITL